MSRVFVVSNTNKDIDRAAKFGEVIRLNSDLGFEVVVEQMLEMGFDEEDDYVLIVGSIEICSAVVARLINIFEIIHAVVYNPKRNDYYQTELG
jgi:hypothetical protein